MNWQFTIDNPMGYVRTTQRQKWVDPRARRYAGYKERVRALATQAGVPLEIGKDQEAAIEMKAYWRGKAKVDLDNLIKGLGDSLWRQDRRVMKIQAQATEHDPLGDQLWVEVEVNPL